MATNDLPKRVVFGDRVRLNIYFFIALVFVATSSLAANATVIRFQPPHTNPGKKLKLKYYDQGPKTNALGITGAVKKFVESNSEVGLVRLTEKEVSAVDIFLDSINARLSQKVKETLFKPIRIGFVNLRSIKWPESYPITKSLFESSSEENPCNYPRNEEEAKSYGESFESQLLSNLFEINDFEGPQSGKALLVLDAGFLPHILKGEPNVEDFLCGHKSFYRAAQGEVFRAIGQVYDSITKASEHRGYRSLANFSSPNLISKFLGLHQFKWKKSETRSTYRVRTPDVREFASPQNHYWINFEYFHLDPEYKCRRPAHFLFLSKTLAETSTPYDPIINRSCSPYMKLPIANTQPVSLGPGQGYENRHIVELVDISPQSIYSIDSNLAGKGTSLPSRWGHAMLRLSGCRNFESNQNGEKVCTDFQKSRNVVVSFRANITDLMQNNLTGFFGGYASQSFIFRQEDIEREYTKEQLRDLFFLPLKISEEERKSILYMIATRYWDYFGTYKFLSNNCATDQWNLIQAGLPFRTQVQENSATLIETPKGVENRMSKIGLFNEIDWISLQTVKKTNETLSKLAKVDSTLIGARVHPTFMPEISKIFGRESETYELIDHAFGYVNSFPADTRDFENDPFQTLMYPSSRGELQAHYNNLLTIRESILERGLFSQIFDDVFNKNANSFDPVEWVSKTSTRLRYNIYQRLTRELGKKKENQIQLESALTSIRGLERFAVLMRRPEALADLFSRLEEFRKDLAQGKPVGSGIDNEILEFERLRFEAMPWRFVPKGYGIPLKNEVENLVVSKSDLSVLARVRENLERTDSLIKTFIEWGKNQDDLRMTNFYEFSATESLFLEVDLRRAILREKQLEQWGSQEKLVEFEAEYPNLLLQLTDAISRLPLTK